jgi:hypothetical protein
LCDLDRHGEILLFESLQLILLCLDWVGKFLVHTIQRRSELDQFPMLAERYDIGTLQLSLNGSARIIPHSTICRGELMVVLVGPLLVDVRDLEDQGTGHTLAPDLGQLSTAPREASVGCPMGI